MKRSAIFDNPYRLMGAGFMGVIAVLGATMAVVLSHSSALRDSFAHNRIEHEQHVLLTTTLYSLALEQNALARDPVPGAADASRLQAARQRYEQVYARLLQTIDDPSGLRLLQAERAMTAQINALQDRIMTADDGDSGPEGSRWHWELDLLERGRLERLANLLAFERSQSEYALATDGRHYRTHVRRLMFLGLAALLLGGLIALLVTRRVGRNLRVLQSENSGLRSANHDLSRIGHRERLIRDQFPYGVIVTDHAGHITVWNRAAERLSRWPAAEVMGEHLSKLLTCPDQVVALDVADTAEGRQDRAQALRSGDLMLARRDCSPIVVSASVQRIAGHAGSATVIVLREDVTRGMDDAAPCGTPSAWRSRFTDLDRARTEIACARSARNRTA